MKKTTPSFLLTSAGLLLSIPSAYFILIAVMKYEWNINGPFDSIAPFLESAGISEPIGWNINLLILFGPVVGLLLCITQVLSIQWEINREAVKFHFTVRKRWFPLLVAAMSGSLIAFLFIYMVGENCIC